MLNGTMIVFGLQDRWLPDWRMRRFFEEVERLLATPDEQLMDAFTRETLLLQNASRPDNTLSASSRPRMRHPREITMACIDLFRSDRDKFELLAREMTRKCAV